MSKKVSFSSCLKSWVLLLSFILLGVLQGQAATGVSMGTFPSGFETTKVTPTQDGYVMITFDSPTDMTGAYGIFYTWASYGADVTLTAVECDGTPAGPGNVQSYGPYEMYTGATKVVYQVTGGVDYCVWNSPTPGSIEFYTEKPSLGGGSTGGATGESMGTFPAGYDTTKVEPTQDGYVMITFDSPTDMTGAYGIFYTWASYGADVTLTAVECDGTPAGPGNVQSYGPYEMYTGVTKVVYQVTGGVAYCVWNSPTPGSIEFYTEKPSLGGGSTEDPVGESMGTFPSGYDTTKVEPTQDGYVMITFDKPTDMTGAYGIFYTWASYGADVTLTAVECDGTPAGPGNVQSYGPYEMYTGATKVVYQVTGGVAYCVWNSPTPGSIEFFTEKPNIGGGGSDTPNPPTPSKNVFYICTNEYPNPADPYVAEEDAEGHFNFTLENASWFRASTTKSDVSGDWSGFEAGEWYVTEHKILSGNLNKSTRMWDDDDEGYAQTTLPKLGDYTGYLYKNGAYYWIYIESVLPPEINPEDIYPEAGFIQEGWSGTVITYPMNVKVASTDFSKVYVSIPGLDNANLTVASGDLDAYTMGINDNQIYITLKTTSKYYNAATEALANTTGNDLAVSVVVPVGTYTLNGNPMAEALTVNYTVPSTKAPVDFNAYTYNPDEAEVESFGFYGATFTWPEGYDVKVVNEEKIYITNPNPVADNLTAPYDLAIGQALADPLDPNGATLPNTLTISLLPSQYTDPMTGALLNPNPYAVSFGVGIPKGAITINGEALPNDIEIVYTLAPGVPQLPDPTSVPMWGTQKEVNTISEITLSWDGFYVASDTGNKLLSNLNDDIFVYTAAWGQAYYPGAEGSFTKVAVKSVEGVGSPVDGVWYPAMKVTFNEPLADSNLWYTLDIPAYNLLYRSIDTDQEVGQDEAFDKVYTVAGEGGLIIIPAETAGRPLPWSEWEGLIVKGQNLSVNESLIPEITLYEGWPENDNEAGLNDLKKLGTGVLAENTSTEVKVEFPDVNLYNHSYTIYIPAGAINPVGEKYIKFSISGNAIKYSDLDAVSEPANGQTVESIESVKIGWNNYEIPLAPAAGTTVAGKMTVNGTSTNINYTIVKAQVMDGSDGSDGGEIGGIDGAYTYYAEYTPATAITAAGEYTFSINADQIRMTPVSDVTFFNEEVSINVTVEGSETPSHTVYFTVTGDWQDVELAEMGNEGYAPLAEEPQQSYTYSFDGTSATVYVIYKAEDTVDITATVPAGSTTYTVGTAQDVEDVMMVPLTLYAGVKGQTITINAARPELEIPTVIYAAVNDVDYNFTPNTTTDTKLTLQANGTYAGKFEVKEKTDYVFWFYSQNSDGSYTYYSAPDVNGEMGFAPMAKLNFSSSLTLTQPIDAYTSKNEANSFRIDGWPAGYVGGEMNAVINLETMNAVLTLNPTIQGEVTYPDQLYLAKATGIYSWNRNEGKDPYLTQTQPGVYEGEIEVPVYNYFKFYNNEGTNGTWFACSGAYTYQNLNFGSILEYSFTGLQEGTNTSIGGWQVQSAPEGNTTATFKATVNMNTKTVKFEAVSVEPEPEPELIIPETLYVAMGNNENQVLPTNIMLTETSKGVFEGQFKANASSYFKFYSPLDSGDMFYGPTGADQYGPGRISMRGFVEAKFDKIYFNEKTNEVGNFWIYEVPTGGIAGEAMVTVYIDFNDQKGSAYLDPVYDQPEPGNGSFNLLFTGVADAYKQVTLYDEIGIEIPVNAASLNYEVDSYPTSLTIVTPEDYEVTVTSTLAQGDETWTAMTMTDEEDGVIVNKTFLEVYAAANGLTFTVELSDNGVQPAPDSNAIFHFDAVEGAMSELNILNVSSEETLTPTDNTLNITYDVYPTTITFTISDEYSILISQTNDDVADSAYEITPTQTIEQGGKTVNQASVILYEGSDGVEFSVVIGKENVEPEPETSVLFTVNVPDAVRDMLNIVNDSTDEQLTLDENNQFEIVFDTYPVSLTFSIDEPYKVEIIAPEGLEEGKDYEIIVNEVDGKSSVTLKLYEGADEADFIVKVIDTTAIINIYDFEGNSYKVFNLNGVLLLDTENASDLNLLEPGLYIVNGKKIVIR